MKARIQCVCKKNNSKLAFYSASKFPDYSSFPLPRVFCHSFFCEAITTTKDMKRIYLGIPRKGMRPWLPLNYARPIKRWVSVLLFFTTGKGGNCARVRGRNWKIPLSRYSQERLVKPWEYGGTWKEIFYLFSIHPLSFWYTFAFEMKAILLPRGVKIAKMKTGWILI